MNERIKQLAQQCWDTRIDGRFHFDQEKFAELIVRECLQQAKEVVIPITADAIESKIKEHFGVK
jgi:hypothetical protein